MYLHGVGFTPWAEAGLPKPLSWPQIVVSLNSDHIDVIEPNVSLHSRRAVDSFSIFLSPYDFDDTPLCCVYFLLH